MGELKLPRASDFALEDVVFRAVAFHQPPQRFSHFRIALLGTRLVRMVYPFVYQVKRILLLEALQHDAIVVL